MTWKPLDLVHYEGVHPTKIGRAEFSMREGLVHQYRAMGNWQMVFAADFIEGILNEPSVTFQGLGRPELQGGFCYAGIPSDTEVSKHATIVGGETFVIFMTDEFRISEYGWEKESPNHPGFPEGYDDPGRFGRILWPPELN